MRAVISHVIARALVLGRESQRSAISGPVDSRGRTRTSS